TAFYRFGEVNHDDCITLRGIGYDIADNQIDTLSKAFQATTVACARCHDHKLDAIAMKDYYALLGVLRSSRMVSQPINGVGAGNDTLKERMEGLKRAIRDEIGRIWLNDARVLSNVLENALARLDGRKGPREGGDPEGLKKLIAALKADRAPLD